MMTMIRVVPEKEYDAILERKNAPGAPAEHHHGS